MPSSRSYLSARSAVFRLTSSTAARSRAGVGLLAAINRAGSRLRDTVVAARGAARERLLVDQVRFGLERVELFLYFQPLVGVKSDRVHGAAEAVVGQF